MIQVKPPLFFVSFLMIIVSQSFVLAEPLAEELFFKDLVSQSGSRRVVKTGEDVILECEAAGRPSPIIYWEYNGIPLNPVYYSTTFTAIAVD